MDEHPFRAGPEHDEAVHQEDREQPGQLDHRPGIGGDPPHKLRAADGILPVVDDDGRVRGIISNKIFIEKYLPLLKVSSAKRSGI